LSRALFLDLERDVAEVADRMLGGMRPVDKNMTLVRALVKGGHIDGVFFRQGEELFLKARIDEALGRRLGVVRERFVITVGHISKESEERRVDEDPAELQDHELMA